ncbi:MAG: DUF3131 domain-containing protein [Litoreibacter sp.]|nr:DUF3131 domain-containing protein [Litoreibacter sp.]
MKRRTFLTTAIAGTTSLPFLGFQAHAASYKLRTLIVLSDISPDTPLDNLSTVLTGLRARGIPFCCVINPDGSDGTAFHPQSELAQFLRKLRVVAPNLIEFAPHIGDLNKMPPYLQARATSEARMRLIAGLGLDDVPERNGQHFYTVATNLTEDPVASDFVRSAGVRNILSLPEAETKVSARMSYNGVLNLRGGARVSFEEAIRVLPRVVDDQFQNLIIISASGFAALPNQVLDKAVSRFCDAALEHEQKGTIALIPPASVQIRADTGFSRQIALHLFEDPNVDREELNAIGIFKRLLIKNKFDFSTGLTVLPEEDQPAMAGYWFSLDPESKEAARSRHQYFWIDPDERGDDPDLISAAARGPGIGLMLESNPSAARGIDRHGRLHVPLAINIETPISGDDLVRAAGTINDVVITISPSAIRDSAGRKAVIRALNALWQEPVSELMTLDTYVERIVPSDPVLPTYLRTEAARAKSASVPQPRLSQDRVALLEDAKTAWSYIDALTHPRTGLCPTTVFFQTRNRVKHNSATMWDVGSLINALIAAVDIGLIDPADFRERYSKVLASIAGTRVNGLLLPGSEIDTRRVRWKAGFNSFDTTRLLSSLHRLARHPHGDSSVEALVASWDLDEILIGGRIHSIKRGRHVSDYWTVYSHYSALGMRAWGFEAHSPYDIMTNAKLRDERMALLYRVAEIAPIGAEPMLLELLEFEDSPPAEYLSEVLFAAQLDAYEKTGEFFCPNEGPLDREPWFSYQGFRVDVYGNPWTIATLSNKASHKTMTFWEDNKVVSSKAAFMWAATHPHPYSTALVEHVRDVARTPYGFASSIYTKTGKPTKNYTDLNTNGIILQAIAKMLLQSGV